MTNDSGEQKIPWWTPQLGEREQQLAAEVIASGFPNDGPVSRRMEAAFAALCGCEHAIAVTSGTTAITVSLMAAGVGPGDEVLVPDITFIATANAVALTGARAVLVDVEPEGLCMDPQAAAAAITPRTKAIVPVHVSGRSADMPAFMALAEQHGLAIIEDATEALGSRSKGRALGAIGHAGCFSLTASKMITTGQGGVIVTHDEGLAQRARELKDQGRPQRGTGFADLHPTMGYNFKFTDIQAAVGIGQLERLDERLERLRRTYEIYNAELANLPRIRILPFDVEGGERPLWVDAEVDDRASLIEHLSSRSIETRPFWYPLHTQEPYLATDEAFPVSTRLAERAVWLPSAFTLSDDQIRRVCREVVAWARA